MPEDPLALPSDDRRAEPTASSDALGDVTNDPGNRLGQAISGGNRPIVADDSSSPDSSSPSSGAAAHPCLQLRGSNRTPEAKYVEPMKTKNAPRTAISVSTTAFVMSFSLPLARTGERGASWPSKSTARRLTPGSLEAELSARAAADRRGAFTRARGSRAAELTATGGSAGSDDAI
jgi:hypothetical protein